MFTIFALMKAPDLTPEGLAELLAERYHDIDAYTVSLTELAWPRFTNVDLVHADGWTLWFQIRHEDGRSLDPPTLGAFLRHKSMVPDGFDDYDTELVAHFGDDPDQEHTNDILFLTEFLTEQFPGVVLYNADAEDVF